MTHLSVAYRKLRNFINLSLFVQGWFLPAWIVLGLSRMAILGISFRRLAPRLGVNSGIYPWVPLLDTSSELRAREIGRIVRLAARYTPWESNCFPQAVTARILLGIYGIPYTLFFGLAREEGSQQMKAHAWVATGRVQVTGGFSFNSFTVVGCFSAPAGGAAMEPAGESG